MSGLAPPSKIESVSAIVRFAVPGFHRWPDARGIRAYLAQRHRHLFHVEVTISLVHNERDMEFHDLLDFCENAFPGGDMGNDSCETMATKLAEHITSEFHRSVSVSVFEDGEVGATVRMRCDDGAS